MRITLIAEGHTPAQRRQERWGLSFLIGDDILFDAFGRADVFMENIHTYSIDLTRLRHIVISHDDWDHIAGLWDVLKINPDVNVYICKHAGERLAAKIEASGARLIRVDGPAMIKKNVYSTGELSANTDRGVIREQSLVLISSDGSTVVTGCAHPGIDIITEHAVALGHGTIRTVIGGFHLKDNPRQRIESVIGLLRDRGVEKLFPLHCTGETAVHALQKTYGNDCHLLSEGDSIEI